MHRVEGDREVVLDQGLDLIEVEQLLHQGDVVIDPINHLQAEAAHALLTDGIEVDRRGLEDAVAVEGLGAGVDRVRQGFRGGTAVGAIHLDPEITVGATGVVAGREDDPGGGLVLADQVGGGRGGEDAAAGCDDAAHAVGGRHAGDHADGFTVAEAAIATDDEGAALHPGDCAQDRLDEALEVVGRGEVTAALAQT